MRRRAAYLASLVIVLLGLAVIPMPYVLWSPGDAVDLREALSVEGQGDPISGPLAMLTVRTKEAALLDVVRGWIDADRELIDRRLIFGEGGDAGDYFEQERQVFTRQIDVSTVVALRALGQEIAVGQQVVEIVAGTPADGVLMVNDILRAVDGVDVESLADLREQLDDRDVGDEVTVTLDRDGQRRDVALVLDLLPESDAVGLGVRLQTHFAEIPVEVTASDLIDRIGGPSAGLALALTIHDLLSPVDVVRGRSIVVTGTVRVDGVVGNIGALHQKVVAAEDAGAELMLVPAGQLTSAQQEATRIRLIGVRTFEEALAALTAP